MQKKQQKEGNNMKNKICPCPWQDRETCKDCKAKNTK
jgi:hypothetical protein